MMNKVLKKSTAFCLIVTILLSVNTIAFADSVETEKKNKKAVLSEL